MTARFVYAGRLAPIGRDFAGFIPGVGMRTLRIHECGLPLANRAKVRVAHDEGDVGEFASVIADRGWFVGTFSLDPQVVDEQAEHEIRVGQPLSIGLNIARSEMLSGVEHVIEGHLVEVSLCREGRIPGAEILWKNKIQVAERSRVASVEAPPVTRKPAAGTHGSAAGEVIDSPPGQLLRRYNTGRVLGIRLRGPQTLW